MTPLLLAAGGARPSAGASYRRHPEDGDRRADRRRILSAWSRASAVSPAGALAVARRLFLLFTLGELYILPNGLGIFARLAPPKLGATTVAAWYLAIFAGSLAAGFIGSWYSSFRPSAYYLLLTAVASLQHDFCSRSIAVRGIGPRQPVSPSLRARRGARRARRGKWLIFFGQYQRLLGASRGSMFRSSAGTNPRGVLGMKSAARAYLLASAVLLAGGPASPAMAKSAQPADAAQQSAKSDQNNQEAIVVTAQKRAQVLIDVPQSVTVVGGAALERNQATNFQDYLKLVPGLQLTQSNPGEGRLVLRGNMKALHRSLPSARDERAVWFISGRSMAPRSTFQQVEDGYR